MIHQCVGVPPSTQHIQPVDYVDDPYAEAVLIDPHAATPPPKSKTKPATKSPDDAEWIAGLHTDAAYAGLDIERETAKCRRWCDTKRIVVTRARIVSWLNRADVPIAAVSAAFSQPPDYLPRRQHSENRGDSRYTPGPTLEELAQRNEQRRRDLSDSRHDYGLPDILTLDTSRNRIGASDQ